MKLYDLFKLSTRMFKVRTSRTLLTVLGMGIGISAILFLVSLGFGIQKTLLETITTADSLVSLEVFSSKEEQKLNEDTYKDIISLPDVVHISPVYSIDSQARVADKISGAMAIITDAEFLALDGKEIIKGEAFSESDLESVVVSSAFVKLLSKSEDEVLGQTVAISLYLADPRTKEKSYVPLEKEFKVVGLVQGEEETIYMNERGVGEVSGIGEFSRLKIKCSNSQSVGTVKKTINDMGYDTSSLSEVVDQANKVFAIIRVILAFFGVIALFVSAIGMFNTMTVTLLERTEEIGIMKSIGASDGNILTMFIFESTIMGFLGGICGIIIGIGGSMLFNLLVNLLAKSMGGSAMSLFSYPSWFLISILISATVVGFLTGIVPARRASRINPLEALRYK